MIIVPKVGHASRSSSRSRLELGSPDDARLRGSPDPDVLRWPRSDRRWIVQRRVKRSLLLLTFAVVAVVLTPLTASAQSAPSVTITPGPEGALLDATLVRVPVEITCAPMEVDFNQGSAELRQAVSKRAIAVGRGFEDSQIVCDGTPHPNSYTFWAEP